MLEEDEIRAAVIALAEAQAAGEDVTAELPHGEALAAAAEARAPEPFDAEASEDEQRDAAISLVLDAVRAASRVSRLSQPAEWETAGLVPPCMTAEDMEMVVYEALVEHGDPIPEGSGSCESDSAAPLTRLRNKHVASAFSSSNGRCVGASPFKRKAAKEEAAPAAQTEEKPQVGSLAEAEPQAESSTAETPRLPYDCRNIRLLMGASSYYLYDASAMTDAYARWAFLAAEDDPVATFVECVREESAVYPRPMAASSLANAPFSLNADVVEATFDAARAQGRADDIERICASNGDVYFYSTRHLSPRRAEALAEWDAVERLRNV